VREYVSPGVQELHGFLPKSAVDTGVERAVDLEERVEVGQTQLSFIVGEETCNHEEVFKGKLGGGAAS
jgi:hypothetical protein